MMREEIFFEDIPMRWGSLGINNKSVILMTDLKISP